MKVGDLFYVCCNDLFGRGYELEKRWVSEVSPRGYRSLGGATDQPHEGHDWPWNGDPDPKVAFTKYKTQVLADMDAKKRALRKEIKELALQEAKVRALPFEAVPVRDEGETFERFKRNWELDY